MWTWLSICDLLPSFVFCHSVVSFSFKWLILTISSDFFQTPIPYPIAVLYKSIKTSKSWLKSTIPLLPEWSTFCLLWASEIKEHIESVFVRYCFHNNVFFYISFLVPTVWFCLSIQINKDTQRYTSCIVFNNWQSYTKQFIWQALKRPKSTKSYT